MNNLESIKIDNKYIYNPFFKFKVIKDVKIPRNYCSQDEGSKGEAFWNYAENNVNVPQKILFKRPIDHLSNLSLRSSISSNYQQMDFYGSAYYRVQNGSIYVACMSPSFITKNLDNTTPWTVDISKYFSASNFINNNANITIYNYYLFLEQTIFKNNTDYRSFFTKQWASISGINYYLSSKVNDTSNYNYYLPANKSFSLTDFITEIESEQAYSSQTIGCIFPTNQYDYSFDGHEIAETGFNLYRRYIRAKGLYIFKIDYNYFINDLNFETVDYNTIRTFFNQEIFQNAQVYTILDYGNTLTERTNLLNNIQDYLIYPEHKYLYSMDKTGLEYATTFMDKDCYSYINGNIYLDSTDNEDYICFTQSKIDEIFNPTS